jgi:hypothetical protein
MTTRTKWIAAGVGLALLWIVGTWLEPKKQQPIPALAPVAQEPVAQAPAVSPEVQERRRIETEQAKQKLEQFAQEMRERNAKGRIYLARSCERFVRDQTKSEFDAFVDAEGTIKYFGTPRQNFLFDKCTTERANTYGGAADPWYGIEKTRDERARKEKE